MRPNFPEEGEQTSAGEPPIKVKGGGEASSLMPLVDATLKNAAEMQRDCESA